MKTKIILWIAVTLILLNAGLSLGVIPAKTTFDFEKGAEREYTLKIVNNEHKDLYVELLADGPLAEYITLPAEAIHLDSSKDMLEIKFKVKIDKDLPPGQTLGQIILAEKLPDVTVSGNVFSASLKIAHKVIINVPYPKKYVETAVSYEEKPAQVDLKLSAKNLGQENIQALKTTFEIYDGKEKIAEAETDKTSLAAKADTTLLATIDKKKVQYGSCNLLASVFYDDYWLELKKEMILGEPEINVLFFDQYFIVGKINKFTAELLNKWNKEVKNVFIEVFVYKEGKELDKVRTASFDIQREERKSVEGFLDATNRETGDYEFDVVVNYEGKTTHNKFKGSVLTEEDYLKKQKEDDKMWIYLLSILSGSLLAIVVLFVTWHFISKRKGRRE